MLVLSPPPHGPGSHPECEGICPDASLPQGHVVERALDGVVCVDGELKSLWREGGGATGSSGHCARSGSASGARNQLLMHSS